MRGGWVILVSFHPRSHPWQRSQQIHHNAHHSGCRPKNIPCKEVKKWKQHLAEKSVLKSYSLKEAWGSGGGTSWWLTGKVSTCQCLETQVQSLVQEDPTCHGSTKPWATTTKPMVWSPRNTTLGPTTATTEASVPSSLCPTTRGHHDEKPSPCKGEQPQLSTTREKQGEDPTQPKINTHFFFFKGRVPWVEGIEVLFEMLFTSGC